jgi:hypothetical protein
MPGSEVGGRTGTGLGMHEDRHYRSILGRFKTNEPSRRYCASRVGTETSRARRRYGPLRGASRQSRAWWLRQY